MKAICESKIKQRSNERVNELKIMWSKRNKTTSDDADISYFPRIHTHMNIHMCASMRATCVHTYMHVCVHTKSL